MAAYNRTDKFRLNFINQRKTVKAITPGNNFTRKRVTTSTPGNTNNRKTGRNALPGKAFQRKTTKTKTSKNPYKRKNVRAVSPGNGFKRKRVRAITPGAINLIGISSIRPNRSSNAISNKVLLSNKNSNIRPSTPRTRVNAGPRKTVKVVKPGKSFNRIGLRARFKSSFQFINPAHTLNVMGITPSTSKSSIKANRFKAMRSGMYSTASKKILKTLLATLLILGSLIVLTGGVAAESPSPPAWPVDIDWINYTIGGEPVTDYEDKPYENDPTHGIANVQPKAVDIASGVDASGGGAENNPGIYTSVQWKYDDPYSDSSGMTNLADDWLYLRMRVAEDPTATGKYYYKSYHWDILVDVDGDIWKEFVIDINGGGGTYKFGTVGVYYNDDENYEYEPSTDEIWSAEASSASNDYTRVVAIDYGSSYIGLTQYWVEYRIPVTKFKDDTDVQMLGEDTQFRLFFSTSASMTNPLQKDWMAKYVFATPPNITVEKSVEEKIVNPGDIIHYSIYYNNSGESNAGASYINDTIPEYTTFHNSSIPYNYSTGDKYTWELEKIPPGNHTLFVNVTVDKYLVSETLLPNYVHLNYTDERGTPFPDSYDYANSTVIAPEFILDKSVTEEEVYPGEVIHYQIYFNNTGLGNAGEVWVNDTIPIGTVVTEVSPNYYSKDENVIIWHFTDFFPGNLTIYLNVTTSTDLIDGTMLNNNVELLFSDVNDNLYPKLESFAETKIITPNFTIEKVANQDTADPGDIFEYTITYSNIGNGSATHLWINDTIPQYVSFLSANPTETSKLDSLISWHFTNVAPGDYSITVEVQVDVGVPDGTLLENVVVCNYQAGPGVDYPEVEDSYDVTVTAPDMTISKEADTKIADPGDYITYTITYENKGTGLAGNVWINDTIPDHTSVYQASPMYDDFSGNTYIWHFTNVLKGKYTITLKLQVDVATDDGIVLFNNVTLNYTDANGNQPYPEQWDNVIVTVTAPIMTIEKLADVDSADPGDVITYTITVKNTGTGYAAFVWVNDTIPLNTTVVSAVPDYSYKTGRTYTWYMLNVGPGTITITLELRVEVGTADGTELYNNVTLNYTDANGNKPYPEQWQNVTVTVTAPIMAIEKTADESTADPGDYITYTINYNNTGTGVAAHVWVNDTIPEHTTFDSANPKPTSESDSTYTWYFTNVNPGEYSITITIQVNVGTADLTELLNKVTLNYTDATGHLYPEERDTATVIVTAPIMAIEKIADVSTADPGDVITYSIKYNNTGTGKSGNVWVNDTIPADTIYVSASPSESFVINGEYIWHFTDVDIGEYVITLEVRVKVGATDGATLLNKVTLNYTDANGNQPYPTQSDTATVIVTAPMMTISKKADVSTADPGDLIIYTITYENKGTGKAAKVWVNDTIPKHTTYVSSTPSYNSKSDNTYSWLFTMVDKGVHTIELEVRVDVGTPDTTSLLNKVTLNYTDANGNQPYAEQSDTALVIVTAPIMTITKDADVETADPGDIFYYIIKYKNEGTGNAANVWVNDTLPENVNLLTATPAYTKKIDNTLIWYRTNVGKGEFTITLQVSVDVNTPDGTILFNNVTLNYTDATNHLYPEQYDTATVIVTAPIMNVIKEADVSYADPGDLITYTINYNNTGTGKAANVWVNDTIPPDTTYVSSNPKYTSVSGDIYTWHFLNVGTGEYSITLVVNVDVGTPDRTILLNKVTLNYTDATNHPYPMQSDEATVTVTAPIMTISKKADMSTADPGDVITYTITYRNDGTGKAGTVWVNDTIPADTTYVESSPKYNSVYDDTYTWKFNKVDTGVYTITLKVRVDVGTPDGTVLYNNVTLDYTDDNDNQPYPMQWHNISVIVTAPIITVSKMASAPTADPGDEIVYTIKYINEGTGNAANVWVNDTIPVDTKYVSSNPKYSKVVDNTYTWHFTNVPKGTYYIYLTVRVKVGTPDTTVLLNNVTLNYTDANNNLYSEQEDGAIVTVTAPIMTIQKIGDVSYADPGETFYYIITYKNTGTGKAANVWINDTIPPNTTLLSATPNYKSNSGDIYRWFFNNVAKGTYIIYLEMRVDVGTPDKTELLNSVTLNYTDANGNKPYPEQKDTAKVIATAPIMTITKRANVRTADPGDFIIYTITYKNSGWGKAAHVWINDTIPENTTFVTATPGYVKLNGRTYSWHLINVGMVTRTITLKVQVNVSTDDQTLLWNNVTMDYSDATSHFYPRQNASAIVMVTAPVITITKVALVNQADPDDFITYTITVQNTGTGVAAKVWVNDTIPMDTKYDSSTPVYSSFSGDTYTWEFVNFGTGTKVITLKVRVDVGTDDKTTLFNEVTLNYTDANGNQPYAEQKDDATVIVTAPIITIKKLADTKTANPDDIITYTITVKNIGTGVAANVWVNDTIPADTTYDSSTPDYYSYSGNTYTWHFTDVGTGEFTITLKVRVIVYTADETEMQNNVSLEYSDANGNQPYAMQNDSVNVTVTAPILTLSKTANVLLADPGDVITYTITVTNIGTGKAGKVWVHDTIPAETTYDSSSPIYTSYTGDIFTWELTDFGTGSYVITLKVKVDAGTMDRSKLNNTVISKYTDKNSNLYPTLDDFAEVIVTAPDMSITKEGPAYVAPGQNYIYYINYTNAGSGDATNVVITDTLPPQLIYLSSTPTFTSNTSSTYNWVISTVKGYASGKIIVKVQVRLCVLNGTKLVNYAYLNYNDNNSNPYPEERDHNITTVISSTIGDYAWYDSDFEGDQDEVGAGTANLYVILNGSTDFGQMINKSTYTDSNGNYLFDCLPPGKYNVTAYPDFGWGVSTTNPYILDIGPGEEYLDADFGLVKYEIEKTVEPDVGAFGDTITVTLVVKNPTEKSSVRDLIPKELNYTGNTIDDDSDGRVDEEAKDWIDNDGDGKIDEDLGNFLVDGKPITGGLTLVGNNLTYCGLPRGKFTIVFDLIFTELTLEEHTTTNYGQVLVDDKVMAEDSADILVLVYWFNKTFQPIGRGEPKVDDDHDGITDEWGEGEFIDYGDQDGIIEVGELILWIVEYNVTNPFNYTMTSVVMEDRWGGEYGLGGDGDDNDNDGRIDEEYLNGIDDDGDGDIDEDTSDFYMTKGKVTFELRGKTDKIYIKWEIGELKPNETVVMRMPVFTDRNTGINKHFPKGHQEYTSPGHYILNSGAVIKWRDWRDKQGSAHTNVLHADCYDTPIGDKSANFSVSYNRILSYSPTSTELTLREGQSQTFKVVLAVPNDNNLIVIYYLDGIKVCTKPIYNYTPDYYSAGKHNITVIVYEKHFYNILVELEDPHNKHQWNVTVTNYNTKPTAIINSESAYGKFYEDVAIQFIGENSVDSESVLTYSWDFGDGSTSTMMNPIHTYLHDGTYTIQLTVTDHDGLTDSTSIELTVLPSVPMANVIQPTTLQFKVGEKVTFEGSASYFGDSSNLAFAWDFGDGNYSTTTKTIHRYSTEGTYTVTFTVHDHDGDSDQEIIYLNIISKGGPPVDDKPPIDDEKPEPPRDDWKKDPGEEKPEPPRNDWKKDSAEEAPEPPAYGSDKDTPPGQEKPKPNKPPKPMLNNPVYDKIIPPKSQQAIENAISHSTTEAMNSNFVAKNFQAEGEIPPSKGKGNDDDDDDSDTEGDGGDNSGDNGSDGDQSNSQVSVNTLLNLIHSGSGDGEE